MRRSASGRSRRSFRATTRSTIPCSSRNSERWNPSGSGWRIVSWMPRGPAKPRRAFGSARMTSPSIANEAVTPPVVGSASRTTYGTRSSARRPSAAQVLAICMRDSMPSCIRAPPEQEGQAFAGREAERGAAPCAAPRVLLDVGAVDDLPAGLALDPEALGLDLLVLLAEDPRHAAILPPGRHRGRLQSGDETADLADEGRVAGEA